MSALITRPLLAGTVEDIEALEFPVLVTPKLDGIRVLKVGGKIVTRKFKPLPNVSVRTKLEFVLPEGMDGEVMVRNKNFNEIQSDIMSFDGEPDFIFYPFDYVKDNLDTPYRERVRDLCAWFNETYLKCEYAKQHPNMGVVTIDPDNFKDKIRPVVPKLVKTLEEFYEFETQCLEQGFEGVMIRSLDGKYKCGRSTYREGILLKFKRVIEEDGKKIIEDHESEIVSFNEQYTNENPQEPDAFGLMKRSSKKEGMKPANTLGSITLTHKNGVQFKLGSGFSDELAKDIWDNQSKYAGKLVKYKYQGEGTEGRPRFPTFLCFRHEDDL